MQYAVKIWIVKKADAKFRRMLQIGVKDNKQSKKILRYFGHNERGKYNMERLIS